MVMPPLQRFCFKANASFNSTFRHMKPNSSIKSDSFNVIESKGLFGDEKVYSSLAAMLSAYSRARIYKIGFAWRFVGAEVYQILKDTTKTPPKVSYEVWPVDTSQIQIKIIMDWEDNLPGTEKDILGDYFPSARAIKPGQSIYRWKKLRSSWRPTDDYKFSIFDTDWSQFLLNTGTYINTNFSTGNVLEMRPVGSKVGIQLAYGIPKYNLLEDQDIYLNCVFDVQAYLHGAMKQPKLAAASKPGAIVDYVPVEEINKMSLS